MNKSFKIGESNEIIKENKIYDLHNLYDFVEVVLKTKDHQLQLLFEPNLEYNNSKLHILLTFEKINYLEFSPNFGTQIISGLDEMGYKNPGDYDDEWLMDEKQATVDDHLFFRMDGGDFIRIHSQNADLIETIR